MFMTPFMTQEEHGLAHPTKTFKLLVQVQASKENHLAILTHKPSLVPSQGTSGVAKH